MYLAGKKKADIPQLYPTSPRTHDFDVIWNEYLCDATQCFLKIIFTWHGAVLQAPGSPGFRDTDTSVRNQATEETWSLLSCLTALTIAAEAQKTLQDTGKEQLPFPFSTGNDLSLSHSAPNCILTRVFTRSHVAYKELLAKPVRLNMNHWRTEGDGTVSSQVIIVVIIFMLPFQGIRFIRCILWWHHICSNKNVLWSN